MDVDEQDMSNRVCTNKPKTVYKTISGGLIPSIGKDFLRHGILWIIVYFLGFYNFGWKVGYNQYIMKHS